MSERAGQAIQAAALLTMAVAVFTTLASSGQLMLAVIEGVLVPAAVFHEWRWWSARPNGNPAAVVMRMAAIVSLALFGVVIAQGGP
jgi:glucose uptake protein GlcU